MQRLILYFFSKNGYAKEAYRLNNKMHSYIEARHIPKREQSRNLTLLNKIVGTLQDWKWFLPVLLVREISPDYKPWIPIAPLNS